MCAVGGAHATCGVLVWPTSEAHARQARRFCCCDEVVVTTSASSLVELQDDCCGERCTCICCSALQAFQKGGCEHSSKRLIPRCFSPNLGEMLALCFSPRFGRLAEIPQIYCGEGSRLAGGQYAKFSRAHACVTYDCLGAPLERVDLPCGMYVRFSLAPP